MHSTRFAVGTFVGEGGRKRRIEMADLENKLVLIQRMQSAANLAARLDDEFQDLLGIITARKWNTTAAPTDEELAHLGITSAQVTAFVGFMGQLNKLMAGQAVTTTAGRAVADAVRSL
jgi:hypothetical protein